MEIEERYLSLLELGKHYGRVSVVPSLLEEGLSDLSNEVLSASFKALQDYIELLHGILERMSEDSGLDWRRNYEW